MDTEAVFSHVIEGGQPVTLEFATENATAFRWDYLAATMLDEDHYDAYMADIDFALREFAHAQHEARLQFHAMRGREPVTGHHISKQMRFHRARLQHEKAKAFATALAAQKGDPAMLTLLIFAGLMWLLSEHLINQHYDQ